MSIAKQIIELRSQGYTYSQIKSALGCSKGTISYHLGAGQKIKSANRVRDRRSKIAKLIQETKQASPCADCGENYPYWMMDFDHLGNKSFTIAHFRGTATLSDVISEIEKCEVVCSNCHRNRTHTRLLVSGSDTMDLSTTYGR